MKKQKRKIKDNHSSLKLLKDAKALQWGVKVCSFLGFSIDDDVKKNIPDLMKQIQSLIELPDKFNEYFSPLGWIAYESMDATVMKECVQCIESGNIEEGENLLIQYFDEENIEFSIHRLKAIKKFLPRWQLTQNACDDYLEKRYYSTIPLLLIIIDGLVNDVTPDQKGFFASGVDVTVWDSIAGHSSGLKKLTEIFSTSRGKTNEKEITIPYRNGILHGRDINYDNQIVAAKLWSALFAIGDWAKQIQLGEKKDDINKEKTPSWKELFQKIKNTEDQKIRIKEWRKRVLKPGKDFPVTGELTDYLAGTPERCLVEFISFFQKKNYGEMSKRSTTLGEFSINKKAGELSKKFSDIFIKNFRITHITDEAPAISVIQLNLIYTQSDIEYSKTIAIRLIFSNEKNSSLVRGPPNGKWKILDGCFDSILYHS